MLGTIIEGRALFKDMFRLFSELPFCFMQVVRRQGLGMECRPSLKVYNSIFEDSNHKYPKTINSNGHNTNSMLPSCPFSYIIKCHSTRMVSDFQFLASGRCPQQNLTFSFWVRPKNVLPRLADATPQAPAPAPSRGGRQHPLSRVRERLDHGSDFETHGLSVEKKISKLAEKIGR